MKVGKDFWLVIKIVLAIIRALKDVFDNPDEPIENGG